MLLFLLFIITIVSPRGPSLSISNLTALRYTDQNGQSQILKICDKICPRWEEVGDLLGLTSERLNGISMKRCGDVRMCCRDVLIDWLHGNQGGYPTTWEGVVQLLEDMDCSSATAILKNVNNQYGQAKSSKLLEHGMLCLHFALS